MLAQLVVRYALVGDPRYIGELREKYQIADAPPPAAPAGVTEAPSPKPAVEKSVPFEPHIEADEEHALERIINSEDNFLDLTLLHGALYCAAAVCRIEFPPGEAIGTGVLIGPDLLLTNQHVLDSTEPARRRAGALRLCARRSGRRGGGTYLQVQEGFLSRESVGTVRLRAREAGGGAARRAGAAAGSGGRDHDGADARGQTSRLSFGRAAVHQGQGSRQRDSASGRPADEGRDDAELRGRRHDRHARPLRGRHDGRVVGLARLQPELGDRRAPSQRPSLSAGRRRGRGQTSLEG